MIDFKLLIKYSKFVIPALTFLSLSKEVLFYKFFNIQIGSYIALSEVLNPFIGDLIFYALFWLLPTFIIFVFWGDAIAESNTERYFDYESKTFGQRIWIDLKTYWVFWVIQIITIILMIVYQRPLLKILSTAYAPFFFIYLWLRREAMIKHKIVLTLENTTILNLTSIFVALFFLTVTDTFSDVYRVKYGKNQKVTLITDSKIIECVDSLVYLGKTTEYTFVYNRDIKRTEVLNNSSITKIILSK